MFVLESTIYLFYDFSFITIYIHPPRETGGVARNPGRRKQSRATAEETAPSDLPVELQLMMAANASSDAGPSGIELQQAVAIEPAQAEQSGGRKRPNPSSNVEKPAKKMRGRSNMLTVTSQSAQVEVGVTERNGDGAFLGSMTGEFSSETQLEQVPYYRYISIYALCYAICQLFKCFFPMCIID